MAAPAYVNAGTGVVVQTGSAAVTLAGTTAGDVIVLQVLQDGTAGSAVSLSAHSNVENLAGTDNAITNLAVTQDVGVTVVGYQHLYIGRSLGGTVSITVATTGDDLYCRVYQFSGVHTGTTVASVIENATAGSFINSRGLSANVTCATVDTTGPDRLGVQFLAIDDDNTMAAWATWTIPVAAFASATGTDGMIQLQTQTAASATTLIARNGTAGAADSYSCIGFALIPVPSGPTTYERSVSLVSG